MNFRRLLYSTPGKYIISILLGLGLATLFRRACKERNAQACNNNKKTVEFA